MAISKQITTLMGGTIWVESKENHGSTFHFSLDLEPCASDVEVPVLSDSVHMNVAARTLQILVADDNTVNRDVARMMLEEQHEVTTAVNGLEALKALLHHSFDLILMDVQMPIMDGLSATTVIRAIEQKKSLKEKLPGNIAQDLTKQIQGKHIPIVALTAHAMSGDREVCINAGMDSYLTKPIQPKELSSVINALTKNTPLYEKKEKESDALTPILSSPGSPSFMQVIQHLKENTNLQDQQVKQILTAAHVSIKENLDKARKALAKEDYTTLGIVAHTLKGTLLQCGLNDQATIAEAIHQAVRNAERPPFHTLLDGLTNSLAELFNDMDPDSPLNK